jgi:hypothetical protein
MDVAARAVNLIGTSDFALLGMNCRVVFVVAYGIAGLSALGCSGVAADKGNAAVTAPPTESDDGGAPPDSSASDAPSGVQGSPLCNASRWMGCYPDNQHPTWGDCANGAATTGAGSPLACRVQPNRDDAGVAPVCVPSGTAVDGMPCNAPADCAAGYECTSDRRCRAYCCDGSCGNQDAFCDIQTTVAYPLLKVPVCMPITSCGLLDSEGGSCPATQTCALVPETGETTCVAVGPRQAGDECNTDHCARGLVCLGRPGEKTCYTLCHTMARVNECAGTPTLVCRGGIPLFPVPGIGICQ